MPTPHQCKMSASGARKHLQQWQLSMSCIHLHVGQAGNQIGRSFWTLAEEEYLVDKAATRGGESSRARRSGGGAKPLMRPGGTSMFHEDGWARCLAVDSEPKVSVSWNNLSPSRPNGSTTRTNPWRGNDDRYDPAAQESAAYMSLRAPS